MAIGDRHAAAQGEATDLAILVQLADVSLDVLQADGDRRQLLALQAAGLFGSGGTDIQIQGGGGVSEFNRCCHGTDPSTLSSGLGPQGPESGQSIKESRGSAIADIPLEARLCSQSALLSIWGGLSIIRRFLPEISGISCS